MAALSRPDLPPGPGRDLVDALHRLHHEAGWPSLRALARQVGASPTTVSAVFTSPRLPAWGLLALVVEALDGDVARFHRLWLSAGTDDGQPAAGPALAGRREELGVVRRHLEAGTGLLLVAGEAGIGKSRLVDATRAGAEQYVARGTALPLSQEVPLLPVATALRATLADDERTGLRRALAECPPYVRTSLAALLPELAVVPPRLPGADDAFERDRLDAAVAAVLERLAEQPFALLVEDLHWADRATLDLLDMLLARGVGYPVVGTLRVDDPAVPRPVVEWSRRVRRLRDVAVLELTPLTRSETAEQLALLGVGEERVDGIYERTLGQPFFTEQLARHADAERLPRLLSDVLTARVLDLAAAGRAVVVTLAVAARPLPAPELAAVTGLSAEALTGVLHDLAGRALLADDSDLVALRHPLLGEAVRGTLVAGEEREAHRRLATVLAAAASGEPAEIASHWAAAQDREQELAWRIRAAQAAGSRFAATESATHWVRALELWEGTQPAPLDPPLAKLDAYLAAFEALSVARRLEEADRLCATAVEELTDLAPTQAAELARWRGWLREHLGDHAGGVREAARAVRLFSAGPPSTGLARALGQLGAAMRSIGRFTEAQRLYARAAAVSARTGDVLLERTLRTWEAWFTAVAGDPDAALSRLSALPRSTVPDPLGDALITAIHTNLLLHVARPAAAVAAVARPGLEAAERCGVEAWQVSVVRSNLAQALLRAGDVADAAAVIDPATTGEPGRRTWPVHTSRVELDVLRGRPAEAARRAAAVEPVTGVELIIRLEHERSLSSSYLWLGRPADALARLGTLLAETAPTEAAALAAECLLLFARAAVDLGSDPGEMLARMSLDPLSRADRLAGSAAWTATWRAEVARGRGRDRVEPWTQAARCWERLGRPFDAAYCRWRGAAAARRAGLTAVADRLLRLAAHGARQHVPLGAAVRAAGAGRPPGR